MYSYYQPQLPSLKGRTVSSPEEARAAMIDFDGSIFYFPDLSNRKIYTKQFNTDGTCSLLTYQLLTTEPKKEEQFITREEFEKFVNQLQSNESAEKKSSTDFKF